jgi:ribosomal protein S18 acetylase RimI-like enzyme
MTGTESSSWRIRRGDAADVAAVLALWRLAGGRPSATDHEQALATLLARDPEALVLAEGGGAVLGSLIAGWDGWRGSFYRLAVHPDWRRRGLATGLVRAGESRLEALGAVRLTAIVAEQEPAAAALWEAVGYVRQAATGRFVRMVEES